MSIKANCQVVLKIHQLTNLGLPFSGVFCLQAEIYQKTSNKGKHSYAIPTRTQSFQQNLEAFGKSHARVSSSKCQMETDLRYGGKDKHCGFTPLQDISQRMFSCQSRDTVFKTSVIYMDAQDAVGFIGDKCQFVLQLQAFKKIQADNVFLDLSLIYLPRKKGEKYFKQKKSINQNIKQDIPTDQTITFQLQNIHQGFISYAQGYFSASYPCKISFSVIAFTMNFKFCTQKSKRLSLVQQKQIQRSKIKNFAGFVQWTRNKFKPVNGMSIQKWFYYKYVNVLKFLSKKINIQFQKLLIQPCQQNQVQKVGDRVSTNSFPYHSNIYIFDGEDNDQTIPDFLADIPEIVTSEMMLEELNRIHIQNFQFVLNSIFINFMPQPFGRFNLNQLKQKYEFYMKSQCEKRISKTKVLNSNFYKQPSMRRQNFQMLKGNKVKKQNSQYPIQQVQSQIFDLNFDIYYEVYFQKNQHFLTKQQQKVQIKILDTITNNSANQNMFDGNKFAKNFPNQFLQSNMVIVMCHGFLGSSSDMAFIQSQIRQLLPEAYYLRSQSNQRQTEGDLQQMGANLAEQIQNFIKNHMEDKQQTIVNFIGHSMGGIICRAALPKLHQYFSKGNKSENQINQHFGFYCSFGSPHLGYSQGADKLVRAGLWVLKKVKRIKSLNQLTMTDTQSKSLQQTFLYKLAEKGSLKLFKKVILFSSAEDNYVPWGSARISLHKQKCQLHQYMIENILGGHSPQNNSRPNIHRLDVEFGFNKTESLDSFIGRQAHIKLFTKRQIIRVIRYNIPKLFDLNFD